MSLEKSPDNGYLMFGPEPHLPDVPRDEWEARLNKARQLMEEQNIHLLLLASEKNCRYFSASTHGHWLAPSLQPQVVLLPIDQDPVIICGDFFRTTFEAQSWIRDIRTQKDPHQLKHELSFPLEVADVIKEMGYGKSNIAVEQGHLGHMYIPRPPDQLLAFAGALPDAKLVDGDKVVWGCRQIKSALERDRQRKAVAMLREAQSALVEEFRPGMTENQVGKIFMKKAIDAGADWVQSAHISCGKLKEAVFDTMAHFDGITIQTGDYLWLDIVAPYKGYWADNARVFNVGPVSDELYESCELVWKSFDAAADKAGPGVKASEVWEAHAEVIREAGHQPFEMCGHGVGLDIHEPPVLSYSDDSLLQPGMSLELETAFLPGFRVAGGLGAMHYENLLLITEQGSEVVHGLPRDIIRTTYPMD